ncbi:c-type cytochrome [Pararhodobacter zhoushanensis]|uniref:c-type cytochrome n=1 Tax=Pararhodobacter zhoushanensis TaxID=2479545 RepID=UPI001C703DA9|nr:c-type cytochrome [Pararhodobacter zhoushanensis]
MMRSLLVLLLCLAAGGAQAQVPPPGATMCSGCHGEGSILPLDDWTAAEIIAAMAGFKDGSRPATLMPRLAAGFSDEDITAIADWIAAGGMRHDTR